MDKKMRGLPLGQSGWVVVKEGSPSPALLCGEDKWTPLPSLAKVWGTHEHARHWATLHPGSTVQSIFISVGGEPQRLSDGPS